MIRRLGHLFDCGSLVGEALRETVEATIHRLDGGADRLRSLYPFAEAFAHRKEAFLCFLREVEIRLSFFDCGLIPTFGQLLDEFVDGYSRCSPRTAEGTLENEKYGHRCHDTEKHHGVECASRGCLGIRLHTADERCGYEPTHDHETNDDQGGKQGLLIGLGLERSHCRNSSLSLL